MTSSNTVDPRLLQRLPSPIAWTWHRVLAADPGAARQRQLEQAVEALLATVGGLLLADCLRGDRDRSLEGILMRLHAPKPPTLGILLQRVRECAVLLRGRAAPVPFLAPAVDWLVDGRGKPRPALDTLTALIERRNVATHGPSRLGDASRTFARETEDTLRTLLLGASWLGDHRLVRVVGPSLTTTGFAGRRQVFIGSTELPQTHDAAWRARLLDRRVYLASPDGGRLLEVSPFFEVLVMPGVEEERLHVFSHVAQGAEGPRLILRHALTAREMPILPRLADAPAPVDAWLAQARPALLEEPMPAAFRSEDTLRDGDLLGGRFAVLGELGRGGWATVYRVRDEESGREVALKVLDGSLSALPQFRARFKREGQLMRRLEHAHVLAVHGVGELPDGRLWLSMPIADGGTLKRVGRERRPEAAEILTWARQILSALGFLGAQGVTHRDIKPSNFLFCGGVLKLADFGVARDPDEQTITEAHERLGSLPYMAPEVVRGQARPSYESDLYSVGILLHELATGERAVRPGHGLDGTLGRLIRRLCHERPEERAQFAEILAEVDDGAHVPGDAAPDAGPGERPRPRGRSRRRAFGREAHEPAALDTPRERLAALARRPLGKVALSAELVVDLADKDPIAALGDMREALHAILDEVVVEAGVRRRLTDDSLDDVLEELVEAGALPPAAMWAVSDALHLARLPEHAAAGDSGVRLRLDRALPRFADAVTWFAERRAALEPAGPEATAGRRARRSSRRAGRPWRRRALVGMLAAGAATLAAVVAVGRGGPEAGDAPRVFSSSAWTVGNRWVYQWERAPDPTGADESAHSIFFYARTSQGPRPDGEATVVDLRDEGGPDREHLRQRTFRVKGGCLWLGDAHLGCLSDGPLEDVLVNGLPFRVVKTRTPAGDAWLDPEVGLVLRAHEDRAGRRITRSVVGYRAGGREAGRHDLVPTICDWQQSVPVPPDADGLTVPLSRKHGFFAARAKNGPEGSTLAIEREGAAPGVFSEDRVITSIKAWVETSGRAEHVIVEHDGPEGRRVRMVRLSDGALHEQTLNIATPPGAELSATYLLAWGNDCYFSLRLHGEGWTRIASYELTSAGVERSPRGTLPTNAALAGTAAPASPELALPAALPAAPVASSPAPSGPAEVPSPRERD